MTDSYSNLDLDVIKKQVCEFAPIQESRIFIMEEDVSFNPLAIRKASKETAEALKLLKENVNIGFDGIRNVNDLLEKADKGMMLNGPELRNVLVFHNHCSRIVKAFGKFSNELSIKDYPDSINLKPAVFEKIERCIDNSGEIKDDASDRLRQLNLDLERCEKDLYNRAHSFIDKHGASLQEPSIYLRNDRITFLIKNSDKNKYQGYTYGSSSSGLAFYVEPASFIEGNNRKISLMQDREEEIEPELDSRSGAIHVRVMGEVQVQILQAIVQERYGIGISFGDGRIVYRETIATAAEGIGHFEPLRHYAEVHLVLEPGESGSGICYESACPTDVLQRHWQRLILSMLKSHRQVGVLTGSELTDVRVTLVSGRAHHKHTVGGDFRQAGRRALRQGLMKCESVLL